MPTKKWADIRGAGALVSIEAAQGDAASPPQFESKFYTGGALEINGWDMPVVVDLEGLSTGNVLVANLDHDSSKRVGNFTVENDRSSLVAKGAITAVNQWAQEVTESAIRGYQFQSSLEVRPTKVETVKAGAMVTVNGQTFKGPLYVTRKGVLKGFAFVSHGADDNTTASIAAGAAQLETKEMNAEVLAWVKEMCPSLDTDTLSDEQKASFEADYNGQRGKRTNPAPAPIKGGSPFEEQRAEIARRTEIEDIAKRHVERNPYDHNWLEGIAKRVEYAIEAKMTPQDFRNKLYDEIMPTGVTLSPSRPRGDKEVTDKVLQAAICLTGNLSDAALNASFDDKTLQTARDKYRHGIGLKELYRLKAKQHGYREDGESVTQEMQAYAFHHRGQPIHGSGDFSTMSLPGILSNSAYKFLEVGWGSGEMTWKDVTSVRPVRDFKQVTSYRLGGALKYLKVGPGGELEHGAVSETSYTNQAETYGRMFAITRTDIINDDLGALTQVPLELGIAANDAFNEVFWTEFLENAGNFYHSSNGNTSTGVISSSAVLATLAAAEAAFLNQTKPNGTPLGILPNVWLVPPLAKRIAMSAMNSTSVTGGSSTVPDVNTFTGEYKVVCSAYIANSAYTNYSTVKHYLICNRPGFSPIETVFLNGRSTPIVETAESAFNTLGMQMRAYHDFGCNKKEYRAVVQGSGA